MLLNCDRALIMFLLIVAGLYVHAHAPSYVHIFAIGLFTLFYLLKHRWASLTDYVQSSIFKFVVIIVPAINQLI